MTQRVLLIDLALAVLLAAVAVIVLPGVAVVAIIALIVLVICGVSLAIDSRRRRRFGRPRRRRS